MKQTRSFSLLGKHGIRAVNVEHGVSDKPKTAENSKKKIAVIDSGVDITEDIDVADRVDLLYAGEESSVLCCDMTGHGTAVASIICAKDDDNGVTGTMMIWKSIPCGSWMKTTKPRSAEWLRRCSGVKKMVLILST